LSRQSGHAEAGISPYVSQLLGKLTSTLDPQLQDYQST